jgi:hypothetical protein
VASYTSTQTGSWGTAATWGGGGTPTAGDTATIADGHTVTASGTQACASFTVQATGKLVVAGTLTFTADSQIAANSTAGNRVEVQAGGVLEGSPGASGTLTLWLGGTTEDVGTPIGWPTIRLDGAAGNRATIRKKSGDAGAFQVRPAAHNIFGTNRGATMLSADYGLIQGLSLFRTHHVTNEPVTLRFVNSEFDGGRFQSRTTVADPHAGPLSVLIQDSVFTGSDRTALTLDMVLDGTLDRSAEQGGATLRRCVVNGLVSIDTLQESGNGCGLLAEYVVIDGHSSIGTQFTYTPGGTNNATFRNLFIRGDANDVGHDLLLFRGRADDVYLYIDLSDFADGNPHYLAVRGNVYLNRAVWDYFGAKGLDGGDPFTAQVQATGEVYEGILAKGTETDGVDGINAGTFWAGSTGADPSLTGGILILRRCSFYGSNQSRNNVTFTHSNYTGPNNRVRLTECFGYTDDLTGAVAMLRHEVFSQMPDDMATVTNCWAYGYGTFTNKVGGVDTSGYALRDYLASTALPAINELEASPGLTDPERNFIKWGRSLGNTGTDAEVNAATWAYLKADPTRVDALMAYVRAGWTPSNTALRVANGGTEWVGAVQGASSGGGATGTGGARVRRLLQLLGAA